MNPDIQAANNYGDALFAAAKDAGVVAQLIDESAVLAKAMDEVPQFVHFIEAPNVSPDEKLAFVTKVMGDRFHRLLKNFLLLMIKRNRWFAVRQGIDRFRDVAEKDMGIYRGTVRTAVSLSDEERARLLAALQHYTGHTLTIDYKIEPGLLGGVVFQSGDLLMDNSLQTQLGRLGERLLAAKVV